MLCFTNLWQAQRPVPLLEEEDDERHQIALSFQVRTMDLKHFVLFCYICVTPVHTERKLKLSPVSAIYNSAQS